MLLWLLALNLNAKPCDCGPRARGLVHLAAAEELYVIEDDDAEAATLEVIEDPPAAPRVNPMCAEGSALERDVCARVNGERRARGLRDLRMDPSLTRVAEAYAQRIYAYNQSVGRGLHLDQSSHHVGGDLMGRLMSSRVNFTRGGENLHSGSTTADSAVRHWMASPNHHEEIVTPEYRRTGVGQYNGIWVQVFTD